MSATSVLLAVQRQAERLGEQDGEPVVAQDSEVAVARQAQ
jgi:hypothetical protein